MPKHKSNRGAAKRFRVTGTGKLKHKKSYLRHILTSKSTKTKRNMRKAGILHKVDEAAMRKMLPHL